MGKLSLLMAIVIAVLGLALWRGDALPMWAESRQVVYREPGWMPPRPSDRWRCIVIHHSATRVGGARRFDQYHRARDMDELAYHFVIGNGTDTADGQVEVGPRWAAQKHGAHCKTPDEFYNQQGIGICLVGNFEHGPPSPAQLESLRKLTAYLCRQFSIPPSRVYTHGQVTGKTLCPGAHFDLAAFRKSLAPVP